MPLFLPAQTVQAHEPALIQAGLPVEELGSELRFCKGRF